MLRSFDERHIECKQVFFPNAVFEVHSTNRFQSSRTGLDIRLSVLNVTTDKKERRCEMRTGAAMHCKNILQPETWYTANDDFPISVKGLLDVYMYLPSLLCISSCNLF